MTRRREEMRVESVVRRIRTRDPETLLDPWIVARVNRHLEEATSLLELAAYPEIPVAD